jgi:hypothetical protein
MLIEAAKMGEPLNNLPQNGLRWDDDQPFLALKKPSPDLETSRPRRSRRLRLRTMIFQVLCSQKRGAIHLGWSLTNG